LDNIIVDNQIVQAKLDAPGTNKSPGVDDLHPRVLKEVGAQIVTPLALIFNQTLSSGSLPKAWKCANVETWLHVDSDGGILSLTFNYLGLHV
jgi:hypothetical protein